MESYESLDETIRSKQSRRASIETFLETLAKADLVDKFNTVLWWGLVDFVTVYSTDDVRFTVSVKPPPRMDRHETIVTGRCETFRYCHIWR